MECGVWYAYNLGRVQQHTTITLFFLPSFQSESDIDQEIERERGMASFVISGFPMASTATTGGIAMMNAAAASSAKGSENKGGLLDWLNDALDKQGLLETDPILNKVEGSSPPPPPSKSSGPKKPAKKGASNGGDSSSGGGGGLFGLFGKK